MSVESRAEGPLTAGLHSRAVEVRLPINGTFELTPRCNFNCKMCYVHMTDEACAASGRQCLTMQQWLQLAEEAKAQGMLYLLLTGGEPLLYPDFWPLYEALIHMGFLISINTNGSLIDEAVIRRFQQLPPTRINITRYGATEESYRRLCGVSNVCGRVERAILGLQEAGILVKLNGTLTPDNYMDAEEIARWSEAHKLIYETTTYMFPPIRLDEGQTGQNFRFSPAEAALCQNRIYRLQYGEARYRQRLEDIRKGCIPPPGLDESCVDPIDGKIRCRAGKSNFWITWDGWMTPCGMMPTPRCDVKDKPFLQAWQETSAAAAGLKLSGVCAACGNRLLCHACAAMALAETGSVSGIPTYLCEMVDAMREYAERELGETGKQ